MFNVFIRRIIILYSFFLLFLDSLSSLRQVPEHVDLTVCSLWETDDQEIKTIRNDLLGDMQIIPDFITEPEEQALLSEVEPFMKKLRYEFDHWDDVRITLI